MKRLEEEYRNTGLKVIWIGFQDKKDNIINFISKHDVDSSTCYDTGDKISKEYGIKYGAGLVMINREGIVKKRIPKGFSEDTLFGAAKGIL